MYHTDKVFHAEDRDGWWVMHTNLTKEQLQGIEGVRVAYNEGEQKFIVYLDPRFDADLVMEELQRKAVEKAQKKRVVKVWWPRKIYADADSCTCQTTIKTQGTDVGRSVTVRYKNETWVGDCVKISGVGGCHYTIYEDVRMVREEEWQRLQSECDDPEPDRHPHVQWHIGYCQCEPLLRVYPKQCKVYIDGEEVTERTVYKPTEDVAIVSVKELKEIRTWAKMIREQCGSIHNRSGYSGEDARSIIEALLEVLP